MGNALPSGVVVAPQAAANLKRSLVLAIPSGLLLLVVLALLAWELLARSGWVNPRLFPSLETIADELWRLVDSQVIFRHAGATLLRVLVGFALAAVGGVLVGFLMARLRVFERVSEPLFSFGYPIPRVALYPIFVVALGLAQHPRRDLVLVPGMADADPQAVELAMPDQAHGVAQAVLAAVAAIEL